MCLERYVPHRVCLYVVHYQRGDAQTHAPLRLEVEQAIFSDFECALLGPRYILRGVYYHLHLVGHSESPLQRRHTTFGRQTHPVERAAEGVRARGFKEDAYA